MELVWDFTQAIAGRIVSTAPFLLILVTWELVIPRERYPLKARLKGVVFWLFTLTSATISYDVFFRTWAALGMQPLIELQFGHWFGWAGPLRMVVASLAALLLADFASYWFHRAQHGRFLWRFHVPHHSINEMHALSSFGYPLDEVFRTLLVVFPMSFIPVTGVHQPVIMTAIILLMPTYTHSPIRLNFGPLRRLAVDNVFHRIHHSTEQRHFDKNFGTYFTIWDQVFGTAYFPAPDEWPATGVNAAREPQSLREWLLMPFTLARNALNQSPQAVRS